MYLGRFEKKEIILLNFQRIEMNERLRKINCFSNGEIYFFTLRE